MSNEAPVAAQRANASRSGPWSASTQASTASSIVRNVVDALGPAHAQLMVPLGTAALNARARPTRSASPSSASLRCSAWLTSASRCRPNSSAERTRPTVSTIARFTMPKFIVRMTHPADAPRKSGGAMADALTPAALTTASVTMFSAVAKVPTRNPSSNVAMIEKPKR
jgi:hypothetical protein